MNEKPEISGLPVNIDSKAEIFSNGNINYNKIKLSETEFIFTRPNSSLPFAKFRESSKQGIFHVQLEDGSQTLGYIEGNKIIVEIPQSDGGFRRVEFLEK